MRLFEITRPKLYLSLNEAQEVDSIIERQGGACRLGALLEGRLEGLRPDKCLPRDRSFYLATTPELSAKHLYEVEPIGRLDRHHTGWLKLLTKATKTSVGELAHYATGYWSGKAFPELRDEPWEYRATHVKVLRKT